MKALFVLITNFAWTTWTLASGGLHLSVDVDRHELYEDESVQLVYSLRYEGQRADFSDLVATYTSPDLEEVSQFDAPTFYQMSYVNGVTRSETQTRVTKVLRPKRKGTIQIQKISVTLDGKTYRADDLSIQVLPSQGARSTPPRGYGLGSPLNISGKRSGKNPLQIRAEVSKLKAVKGEQLIVSFYSYRRGQVGQLEAIKLPDFKGFLKDDPELPVLKRPQPVGPTTLDGWTYEKDLLARYVVYPLEAGTLTIDTLEVRGVAYPDADSIFGNYFNVLNPKRVNAKNEPLKIEVTELPSQGRPKSFQGAVGDINLQSKLDRTETKVGDPVTLLLRLEGRANFASIEAPTVTWPEGVELFDSKSVGRSSQAGVGEKSFEYILIPRRPGEYKLPSIEFSFFNPKTRAYETKRIPPLALRATGAAQANPTQSAAIPDWEATRDSRTSPQMVTGHAELRFLKLTPIEPSWLEALGIWRWWFWIAGMGLIVFVIQVVTIKGRQLFQKARNRTQLRGAPGAALARRELFDRAKQLGPQSTYADLSKAYTAMENLLFEGISESIKAPARALTREDLKIRLGTEWSQYEDAFRIADIIRYGKPAHLNVSEEDLQTISHAIALDHEATLETAPVACGNRVSRAAKGPVL